MEKQEKRHQVAGTTITAEELKALSLKKEEAMFGMVEVMPEFPGGQKALMAYIAKNTNYPQDGPCISGRVIVQFTITKKREDYRCKRLLVGFIRFMIRKH